jgi:tripartite-type tricarboxylate transporter receptor subunit TctC
VDNRRGFDQCAVGANFVGGLATAALPLSLPVTVVRPSSSQVPWKPDGQVTVVIGFPTGGGSDIIGRPVMAALERMWGVPVIVENRPGANGTTAAVAIGRDQPNGRSMLLGHISSNAIAPAVMGEKVGFDPVNGLTPITRIASQAHVLVVNADARANSLHEFVRWAKSSVKPLTYGSTGYGSLQHIAAEIFASMAGIKLTHVPYRGSAPAMGDLLGKQIDCIFEGIAPAAPFVQDKKFRALGLSITERIPGLDIPTIAEQGYPDYNLRGWWAVFGPKGTPPSIVDGWYQAIREGLKDKAFLEITSSLGVLVNGESPDEFTKLLHDDLAKFKKVAADFNITM